MTIKAAQDIWEMGVSAAAQSLVAATQPTVPYVLLVGVIDICRPHPLCYIILN